MTMALARTEPVARQSAGQLGKAAPQSCAECPIRHKSVCGILPPDRLRQIEQMRAARRLRRDEPIAWQGDAGRYLAVVRSGIVKLSASTARGTQLIVGLAFPGTLVGRAVGEGAGYDIDPVGEAEICLLPRHGFDALARDYPPLGHALLELAFSDLDELRKWMGILGTTSAGARLAKFLLHLAETFGIATPVQGQRFIDVPFSRQQIGDLLGMNIETVSRQFTVMRNEGLLTSPNRFDLLIRDMDALRGLCQSKRTTSVLGQRG
ncbi:Crp/Fnr family transcriptional regulator [Alteraurantiacibacter buctensis]|uniref:Helix-turn-helix domain-containing protein n=1 Tax=Alteraurantiacibacter buctensis TaxID=1503981 RepID=A0A844Z2R2_9SPHN|nr:Crp/Fnr family transcriptional regulator [Alteraurantiacibacter buctensis]MXO72974.1 helix-turn-helix domain-containing protein [Alteraurantiacibacter buctensis]